MWWYFSCYKSWKIISYAFENFSLLASERKLQDFCLSHKKFVIPQIHSISHGFSPTKLKTPVVWVRKDLLRWVLFTCPWFNSFNYLRTCLFFFVFGCFVFLGCFDYWKKKSKNIENFQKDKNILFCVYFYFSWELHELWYLSLDLEHAWHCGETWMVCVI